MDSIAGDEEHSPENGLDGEEKFSTPETQKIPDITTTPPTLVCDSTVMAGEMRENWPTSHTACVYMKAGLRFVMCL